ncbi:hypothetical protein [Frankia gtarii]|uniref:hypothetical protein n=1 Tax=Frankia gtarii TaxID=2950102 RepID=UPI0021C09C38|nr:hypothetical protein [Frankia gtarii]
MDDFWIEGLDSAKFGELKIRREQTLRGTPRRALIALAIRSAADENDQTTFIQPKKLQEDLGVSTPTEVVRAVSRGWEHVLGELYKRDSKLFYIPDGVTSDIAEFLRWRRKALHETDLSDTIDRLLRAEEVFQAKRPSDFPLHGVRTPSAGHLPFGEQLKNIRLQRRSGILTIAGLHHFNEQDGIARNILSSYVADGSSWAADRDVWAAYIFASNSIEPDRGMQALNECPSGLRPVPSSDVSADHLKSRIANYCEGFWRRALLPRIAECACFVDVDTIKYHRTQSLADRAVQVAFSARSAKGAREIQTLIQLVAEERTNVILAKQLAHNVTSSHSTIEQQARAAFLYQQLTQRAQNAGLEVLRNSSTPLAEALGQFKDISDEEILASIGNEKISGEILSMAKHSRRTGINHSGAAPTLGVG